MLSRSFPQFCGTEGVGVTMDTRTCYCSLVERIGDSFGKVFVYWVQ